MNAPGPAMRNDISLTNVLTVHRTATFSAIAVALCAAALLAAGQVALGAGQSQAVFLLAAAGLALILLFGVIVRGHFALRRAVVLTEKRRRSIVSSLHRDALTGAYNRRYFHDSLAEMVRDAEHMPVGYLHMDMDHLKAINDGSGHAAGDAALVRLVETLNAVAPGSLVGRLGGDEFAVAIAGVGSRAVLARLGRQILERLDRPQRIAGRDLRLSATIGIAVAPGDATLADELMSKADMALYRGKKSGRHTIVQFSPDLLSEERHQRFVERELRAAILLDQLELHYQPILDRNGATSGYEALVRWHHPVRGMIAPDSFIPVAEKSDLIVKLGQWVLARACRDLVHLDTRRLALNVSACELRHPNYAERFIAAIGEAGIEAGRFVVEVTETAPLNTDSIERRNLDTLRAAGIGIAVDDFGAGHASLGYLRDLSFDIIKIDRSYVAEITHSRTSAVIVAAICQIADTLGVKVVGEGIENPEQLAALKVCGCAYFQGYHLGRPASLAQIRAAREPRSVSAA